MIKLETAHTFPYYSLLARIIASFPINTPHAIKFLLIMFALFTINTFV